MLALNDSEIRRRRSNSTPAISPESPVIVGRLLTKGYQIRPLEEASIMKDFRQMLKQQLRKLEA